MDQRHGPPAVDQEDDSGLAAARLHVQALTENGVSPETLLRALLEKCESRQASSSAQNPSAPSSFEQTIAAAFEGIAGGGRGKHGARLSISTTNSASTARSRASVISAATSVSSTSSQGSINRYSQLPGTQQFNSRPSTRAYWCTSCPQKLQRKFDWKRHEDEFHERYKKYPCPDCNRVFWGANTFNQHHKSRHSCTTCPHAEKVVRYSKRKRAWGCGFCAAFLPSLERYFDHVAVHYESGKTKAHWDHALVIYGLLHQPVVYDAWKALKVAKYGHLPREQQPKISWDPRNTGRSHGFLENENPGHLQDLLEFFDPARDNAQAIVELAWDQAIHVTQASYDGMLDAANVRRPSQYLGHLQLPQHDPDQKQPQGQTEQQQQGQQQQQQQQGQQQQQQQQGQQQQQPEEDTSMSDHKWSPTIATSAPVPLPNTMVVPPPPPPPPTQPMETRPLPQPMALDRALPPPSFEANFYSPIQVDYPSAALNSSPSGPPAPMEFVPFDQTINFGGAPLIFDDWSSIASTMVDGSLRTSASNPQEQQQQQQQQTQLQRQPMQQPPPPPPAQQQQLQPIQHQQDHSQQHQPHNYWPTGIYPTHS